MRVSLLLCLLVLTVSCVSARSLLRDVLSRTADPRVQSDLMNANQWRETTKNNAPTAINEKEKGENSDPTLKAWVNDAMSGKQLTKEEIVARVFTKEELAKGGWVSKVVGGYTDTFLKEYPGVGYKMEGNLLHNPGEGKIGGEGLATFYYDTDKKYLQLDFEIGAWQIDAKDQTQVHAACTNILGPFQSCGEFTKLYYYHWKQPAPPATKTLANLRQSASGSYNELFITKDKILVASRYTDTSGGGSTKMNLFIRTDWSKFQAKPAKCISQTAVSDIEKNPDIVSPVGPIPAKAIVEAGKTASQKKSVKEYISLTTTAPEVGAVCAIYNCFC